MSPIYEPESGEMRNSLLFSGKSSPDQAEADVFSLEQESFKLQADASSLTRELNSMRSRSSTAPNYSYLSESDPKHRLGDSPLDEYQLGRFSPMEQRLKDPVHDFLRGSREIKEDLQRLSDMRKAQQELPSPTFTPLPPQKSDTGLGRSGGESRGKPVGRWDKVNGVLRDVGFEGVRLMEDATLEDVYEVLLTVLQDYARVKQPTSAPAHTEFLTEIQSLKDANKRLKSKLAHERAKNHDRSLVSKHQNHDMRSTLTAAEEKVDLLLRQNSDKDRLIAELKSQIRDETEEPQKIQVGSDHEKAVFKKFFGRDPVSLMDTKVIRLIRTYEDSRLKRSPLASHNTSKIETDENDLKSTIERLTRDKALLDNQKKTLTEELSQLKNYLHARDQHPDPHSLLEQLASTLALKSISQLPAAVSKMQQVIRALPSLEHFIKAVTAEVVPADSRSQAGAIEEVVPTLRIWRQKLAFCDGLSALRQKLCDVLDLDPAASDPLLVRPTQVQTAASYTAAATDVSHFRSLFEVPTGDLSPVMNQVFLFVHEMKGLLQVTDTQFCRETLDLEPGWPLKFQLEAIKRELTQKHN